MSDNNSIERIVLACALRGRDRLNPKYRGKANANFVQMLEVGGGHIELFKHRTERLYGNNH